MRLSAVVWAVVGKVETDDTARFHMVIIILGLGEVQGVSETEKEREGCSTTLDTRDGATLAGC